MIARLFVTLVAFGSSSSRNYNKIKQIIAKYRPDAAVTVYYDPPKTAGGNAGKERFRFDRNDRGRGCLSASQRLRLPLRYDSIVCRTR